MSNDAITIAKLIEIERLVRELRQDLEAVEPVEVPPVLSSLPVRISDAKELARRGLKVGFVAVEYPSVCPFNADNSRFLLIHQDHFALYDGGGIFLRDLTLGASGRPRWSRNDPDWLVYISGNELHGFNVATNEDILVRKFDEYASIDNGGEADIGWDDQTHIIVGDKSQIFTYSTTTGARSKEITVPFGFDNAMLTPNGNVLIAGSGGIGLYDSDLSFIRDLTREKGSAGHHAVMQDADGSEILLWTNANERPVTLPDFPNGIVKIDLSTGKQNGLLSLPWDAAVHITNPVSGKYAYVSTYQKPEAPVTEYSNQILAVALDGSGARKVCDHNSVAVSYNPQPRASVARDGTRLLFNSNGGVTVDPDYTDVWMVRL